MNLDDCEYLYLPFAIAHVTLRIVPKKQTRKHKFERRMKMNLDEMKDILESLYEGEFLDEVEAGMLIDFLECEIYRQENQKDVFITAYRDGRDIFIDIDGAKFNELLQVNERLVHLIKVNAIKTIEKGLEVNVYDHEDHHHNHCENQRSQGC